MPRHLVSRAKNVFVRAYTRVRFGNLENVCAHWRSDPRQLSFSYE